MPLDFEELPQMLPIYSFKTSDKILLHEFKSFATESSGLTLRSVTETSISFKLNFRDPSITKNDNTIIPNGLVKVSNDEKTASSAYHIPHGILFRYGPSLRPIDESYFDSEENFLIHNFKKISLDTLLA